MKSSGRSLFYFGLYKVIASSFFILSPTLITKFFQFPELPHIWLRVIGIFTMVIGIYYIISGINNNQLIIKISAVTRLILATVGLSLIYYGQLPKSVLLVAAFDIAGFTWTAKTLIKEHYTSIQHKSAEFLDPFTAYR